MGYADDLWFEQVCLIQAIYECSDSKAMNELMNQYALVTLNYLAIANDTPLTKASAVHAVLKFFLEQIGVADEGAVTGIHPVPTIESVAKMLCLCSALKQYCQDMYLDDGVFGILKYGSSPKLGHEIVLSALALCDEN